MSKKKARGKARKAANAKKEEEDAHDDSSTLPLSVNRRERLRRSFRCNGC